jgi:hypothetical protein
MKSPRRSFLVKAALLIIPLAWCFPGSDVAQAGDKNPLSPGPVRPGTLDYRTELPQGYLKVYSATDEFNVGDAWYFPHSAYAIYGTGGKLLRNVPNKRSANDEIPDVVGLPVGTYTVFARCEKRGYIHALVVIEEAHQTILHLDLWETPMPARLAHN